MRKNKKEGNKSFGKDSQEKTLVIFGNINTKQLLNLQKIGVKRIFLWIIFGNLKKNH